MAVAIKMDEKSQSKRTILGRKNEAWFVLLADILYNGRLPLVKRARSWSNRLIYNWLEGILVCYNGTSVSFDLKRAVEPRR
jgi:hypothetical protein